MPTPTGVIDVLGSVADSSYEELLVDSVELEAEGMTFRVLGLARLIEVKRLAGRPKDLAVLPLLEATLERRRGGRT